MWKWALRRKRRKTASVSSLKENKSIGPELGTNLRPFARTILSGSDKGKSGGMVKNRLLSSAEPLLSEETERGPNNLANLDALTSLHETNEVWNLTREFYQWRPKVKWEDKITLRNVLINVLYIDGHVFNGHTHQTTRVTRTSLWDGMWYLFLLSCSLLHVFVPQPCHIHLRT